MSNLRGIIINQQLKRQQSPFVLSVTNVPRVMVYHLWKTACFCQARHQNLLFIGDPTSTPTPGSKSCECSFSMETSFTAILSKNPILEQEQTRFGVLGYHMEVRNPARTWAKKFLIHIVVTRCKQII